MDQLTAWLVGGGFTVVLGGLSTAVGLIFNRQEKRIAALEAEVVKLNSEHGNCRVKVATLEAQNIALQGELDELRSELQDLKASHGQPLHP